MMTTKNWLMKVVFQCLFLLCLWYHSDVAGFVKPGNGTFLLNGIFPITDSDGKINHQSGVMMAEAMRWAIEAINNENDLHGYKLGINQIYDSAKEEYVLKNILDTFLTQTPFLIGPYSADTSYLSSILTTTFEQIAISYSATYSHFDLYGVEEQKMLRTVPSDKFRISAALSFIKDLRWNYLAVVSSYGYDGERESLHFTKKLLLIDTCLSMQIDLNKYPLERDYGHALKVLNSDSRLKSVVLFTTINDTKNIMKSLKRLNLQKRFFFICMYGCTNYVKVVDGNEDIVDGMLSLDVHTPEVKKFKEYFLNKKITKDSPKYFKLFWEEVFECYLNQSNMSGYNKECSGGEKISVGKGYYPNTPVNSVIDAIFHIADALHDFLALYCHSTHGWMANTDNCLINVNNKSSYDNWVYKFLMRHSFIDGTLKPLTWKDNENGTKVQYDVFQYTRQHGNQHVWSWEVLRNATSNIPYREKCNFSRGWQEYQNVTRVKEYGTCSKECVLGHVRDYDQNSLKSKCCWSCKKCEKHQRVVNNTCISCTQSEMVGPHFNTCMPLPTLRIEWENLTTLTFVSLSTIGLVLTIFFALVFSCYNDHRIVRASGRDLSYMILIGICLAFLCPFAFLPRTTQTTCILRGALPGFAFLTCYTPLFLKTNRIYRIFVGAQVSVSRPSLVSSGSQFVVLCIILAVQLLISIVWFASKTPIPEPVVYRDKFIAVHCSGDNSPILLILNLSLSVISMVSCTVLAFKTRHFPKNFNEAKYIGITLYITCVAWAVFLPAYYLAPRMNTNFLKEFLMCGVCIFIGFVTLFGLFGQKIKMLLWGPAPPTSNSSLPTWYVPRAHSKSMTSNHSFYGQRYDETDDIML